MEQLRNLGDERQVFWCVYCGKGTETRDHIPPKVFMDKPYPANLPVVPACENCNSGFSLDEEYVACLIECAKFGATDSEQLEREKIRKTLTRKPALLRKVRITQRSKNDVAWFEPEFNRVERIVVKLARGHAAFELNEPMFGKPNSVRAVALYDMSETERTEFETTCDIETIPEIGSRAMQRIAVHINSNSGTISPHSVLTTQLSKMDNSGMNIYKRYRFPPEIISYAVWLYFRFNLSHRDIEDLLAQRGITVTYETIRLWCIKFGPRFARRLKRKHHGYGDTFFIDEVFVKINGKQHYLWRAVDQDGEVVDVFLQSRRDGAAAKRFFKRLLRSHGGEPRRIVTDKLRSYCVAHREIIPEAIHDTSQYANNRAEQSHELTRVRERGMRRFKSPRHAGRFLTVHAAVYNLFNLGRHLVKAAHYRNLREDAFNNWSSAVA